MIVYKYDGSGNFIEPVEIGDKEPIPVNCTLEPLPQPNWKPVFINGDWVETATEEEKNPLITPELTTEERISLVEMALMNLFLEVVYNMGDYLAQRIIDGVYTYDFVISKKPTYKEGIDSYLTEKGRGDLITQ